MFIEIWMEHRVRIAAREIGAGDKAPSPFEERSETFLKRHVMFSRRTSGELENVAPAKPPKLGVEDDGDGDGDLGRMHTLFAALEGHVAPHHELYAAVYAGLNEPDGLPGLYRKSAGVATRLRMYEHQGDWGRAAAARDLLLHDPLGRATASSAGTPGARNLHDPAPTWLPAMLKLGDGSEHAIPSVTRNAAALRDGEMHLSFDLKH